MSLVGWVLSSVFGVIGVIAFVIILIVVRVAQAKQGANLDWNAGIAAQAPPGAGHVRADLEGLRQHDLNFSVVLLEDFLYALYAQAHTLRGGGYVARLSSHLSPAVQAALLGLGQIAQVKAIIVGAMRYLSVSGLDEAQAPVRLEVELESNYTEVAPTGAEQSYYAMERWTLSRAKNVLSRTPDRARVFMCPSCGAPLDGMDGGRCAYCQAVVNTGRFDWVVDNINVVSRETRGPMLTGTTEEQGTDLPTVMDPYVQQRYGELAQKDPQFSWPAFEARVGLIFARMQTSWSNRDWSQARPFVSDNLFQMLGYWIEAYTRAGLRNVTENARVEGTELCRITADRFYDAITVRLYASSTDYTITDAGGKVVGGSRSKTRRYTEYWTLIRGAGKQGQARSDAACPSCGAPLAVEMAGTCTYCKARVTSGEFDWVLSRIEQDEVYQG
jgi:hypothetical protein